MKISTLRNKFEKYCSQIEKVLGNIDNLADEFDDERLSELCTQLTDKVKSIMVSCDDTEINAYMIQEYIDKELYDMELEYNEYED